MSRVIVWFSCGAASACAAKLALEKYGKERVEIVNNDTLSSEHPDNLRFFADVEQWLGVKIRQIGSEAYISVDDVIEKTRFMAGIHGARCTTELKKLPRRAFEQEGDIHIFGYTAEEKKRIEDFSFNNPEILTDWILYDAGMGKEDCKRVITEAKIALPAMYLLGYKNNNCLGCVKATSARYWNKIRRDFPATFAKRVTQSRELGVRLTRYKGQRIFLDELPEGYMDDVEEDLSCGPHCSAQRAEDIPVIPYGAVTRAMVEDTASKASYEKYTASEQRAMARRRMKREQAKIAKEESEGQASLFGVEDLAPLDMMLDNFAGAFK